jgi:hypothetical protein
MFGPTGSGKTRNLTGEGGLVLKAVSEIMGQIKDRNNQDLH